MIGHRRDCCTFGCGKRMAASSLRISDFGGGGGPDRPGRDHPCKQKGVASADAASRAGRVGAFKLVMAVDSSRRTAFFLGRGSRGLQEQGGEQGRREPKGWR